MVAISTIRHFVLSVDNQTKDVVSHDFNAELPV
jgi:hypothetical protein